MSHPALLSHGIAFRILCVADFPSMSAFWQSLNELVAGLWNQFNILVLGVIFTILDIYEKLEPQVSKLVARKEWPLWIEQFLLRSAKLLARIRVRWLTLGTFLLALILAYHDMRLAKDQTIVQKDVTIEAKEKEIANQLQDIARLHQQLDERAARKRKRDIIGKLSSAGRDVWNQGAQLDDQGAEYEAWQATRKEWRKTVIDTIRREFSEEELEIVLGPTPANCQGVYIGRGDQYAGLLNSVCAIRANLQELGSSYR